MTVPLSDTDVPSPIDLRIEEDARAWVDAADRKRPWRSLIRSRFAEILVDSPAAPLTILELGCGPGQLAEVILEKCHVSRYALLDFSQPMLDMACERLSTAKNVEFIRADFKEQPLSEVLSGPFDAVVAMQALHEIRHKRHLPGLYSQVRTLLKAEGLFVFADHLPMSDSSSHQRLYATEEEQTQALHDSGFEDVRLELLHEGAYLFSARSSSSGAAGNQEVTQ